jgi:hypothetical protein
LNTFLYFFFLERFSQTWASAQHCCLDALLSECLCLTTIIYNKPSILLFLSWQRLIMVGVALGTIEARFSLFVVFRKHTVIASMRYDAAGSTL